MLAGMLQGAPRGTLVCPGSHVPSSRTSLSRKMAPLPLTFVTISPKVKHTATVIFNHVGVVVIITRTYSFVTHDRA